MEFEDPGLSDTGLVFTAHAQLLSFLYGASVVSFLVIFVAVICRMTNEVLISRRVIRWVRWVTTLSLCFQIVLVAMELRLEELRDPVWPHYGLVVPVIGGILTFVGYFVNSHPCFRWFIILTQGAIIMFHTLRSALTDQTIDCREDGTCETRFGWSLTELRVVAIAQYAVIFLAIWLILGCGYLAIALGCCRARYPVRLFSESHPLSELPRNVSKRGRLGKRDPRGMGHLALDEAQAGRRKRPRRRTHSPDAGRAPRATDGAVPLSP